MPLHSNQRHFNPVYSSKFSILPNPTKTRLIVHTNVIASELGCISQQKLNYGGLRMVSEDALSQIVLNNFILLNGIHISKAKYIILLT